MAKTKRRKGYKPMTTKDGPFCGARRSPNGPGAGTTCKNAAGYKTDHPGQGRCKYHGGATPIRTTGRYSKVVHASIAEKMEALQALDQDVMDMVPELVMLRALTIDFVNRYEEFAEGLLAWYQDGDSNTKPRRIMDLADAGRLISDVTKIVERIHKVKSEGAITLETFRRVTEQMGIIVAKHVLDRRILAHIELDWKNLALDAKSIDHHEPADTDVEVEEVEADDEDEE